MARLMVVDDEKGIREALVQVFEYDGHQVRAAEDGPDALLAAESFHPDVIFLDVKMPGIISTAWLRSSSKLSGRRLSDWSRPR